MPFYDVNRLDRKNQDYDGIIWGRNYLTTWNPRKTDQTYQIDSEPTQEQVVGMFWYKL